MTREIKVGDKVRLTGKDWGRDYKPLNTGDVVEVEEVDKAGYIWAKGEAGTVGKGGRLYSADNAEETGDYACELVEDETTSYGYERAAELLGDKSPDAVDPGHYKFPGGVEVRSISAHLTSFGGQALQYIARSTRLDGKNKGDTVENLRKAIRFLEWEIERLESDD